MEFIVCQDRSKDLNSWKMEIYLYKHKILKNILFVPMIHKSSDKEKKKQ